MFFSFRDIFRILTSTALSNGFLLVLSLVLARFESTEAYAEFAFSVAVFAVSSLLLDFGLNVSAIKRHNSVEGDQSPSTFASVKLLIALSIVLFGVVTQFITSAGLISASFLVGITCAALNNVWLAVRVTDQSKGDTQSFYRANLLLFGCRLVAVFYVFLVDLDSLHYLLALYAYPYLVLLPLNKNLFLFTQHLTEFVKESKSIFAYSRWIFLSSLLFVASVQLPVLILKMNNLAFELAMLGVAMTVASFSSWLSYSLKPFFIGKYLSDGANHKSYVKLLTLFSIALIPISTLVYFLFLYGYSDKYPGVELLGTIIFFYTSMVFVFGLYNGQIHIAGRPELEALVNFFRAIAVFLVMFLGSNNLLVTMSIVGSVMVSFELILMIINFRLVQNKNENSLS